MYADGRREYDFGVSGTQFEHQINAHLMGVVQSGEKDALRQCAVTEPFTVFGQERRLAAIEYRW